MQNRVHDTQKMPPISRQTAFHSNYEKIYIKTEKNIYEEFKNSPPKTCG